MACEKATAKGGETGAEETGSEDHRFKCARAVVLCRRAGSSCRQKTKGQAMVIRNLPVVVALTLPLAGCVVETVPTRPDLSTCTSNATHQLVGTSISLVNTSQLAQTVRILPPNGIATMDYNPARLNISTDANGIITQVSCG
jgi:Peptidase inhibitor I78 family